MSQIAHSQPTGNYGPEDKAYSIPSGAYFVSANGRGTVPCSKSNPCSITKALSSAPSGTTIVLRAGTYRVFNTKIPRYLKLQPYGSEKVIFKGSELATNWNKDGGLWKVKWTTLFPAVYNRGKFSIVTHENVMANHTDMLFINGTEQTQVETKDQVSAGKFYVDYANEQIFIGSDPTSKNVEITAAQWGLHTYQVSAANIAIRGIEFRHYAEAGIMMRSPKAIIENCTFKQNAIAGIKVYLTPYTKVRHNLFHHNGLHGAGINGADHMIFENNIITDNNSEKFNRNSWSAAGVKILYSKNAIVQNNLVSGNDANGIWLDDRSEGTFVINNEVKDNTRHGIHGEISHNTVIAGNVVTNSGFNYEGLPGAGICVGESSGVRVYNNTLVDNQINLIVSDSNRPEGELLSDTRNTIVKNNLLVDAKGTSYPSAQVWVNMKACGYTVVREMDYNGYHRTDPNHPDYLLRWKVGVDCSDNERNSSLASVQKNFGFEKNGIELIGDSDPFFVNSGSGNYKIKDGSYAVKTGTSVPSDIQSALGWSLSDGVDLGAYQTNYAKAEVAPQTGQLPWKESFDLSDGTFIDDGMNGGTAWMMDRSTLGENSIMEVRNGRVMVSGVYEGATWFTEPIDIKNETVSFSVSLRSEGELEDDYDYDYVRVYYKIDDGYYKLLKELRGNVSGKTLSMGNIKGNTLKVLVKARNTDRTEKYFIDNVNVVSTSTASSAPSAPSAGNLPWEEQFNNGQSFKGSLETSKMYSYGSLEVSNGKMAARGVGQAAWKSDVIQLNGQAVDISMVLSSQGQLEETHDYDAVKIYTIIDGGSEVLNKVIKGDISNFYKFEKSGITGNTLQLVVRFQLSDYEEYYFLDGVEVNLEGTSSNSTESVMMASTSDLETGLQVQSTEVAPNDTYTTEPTNKLVAYPNPASGVLNVSFESMMSQNIQITLIDSEGEMVTPVMIMQSNDEFSIDLTELKPGIYMLQTLSDDGQFQNRRILKQ